MTTALTEGTYVPVRSRVLSFCRLELAEAERSRWFSFTLLSYLAVFGIFVLLGLRESEVLGFTGLSRVVLNASSAIVVVLPLVALVATCQAIVKARSSGAFELFLTQPARRGEWFVALIGSRLIVLVGPLLVALGLLLSAGAFYDDELVAGTVVNCLLITSALVLAFIGIGVLVSAYSRSAERAIVVSLLVWLAASALHDFALIGVLLEFRLQPEIVFALTAINPTEAARLALLTSVDPELSVLGPVGFWLANTLGAKWTLVLGICWPVLVFVAAATLARRKLESSDLVG